MEKFELNKYEMKKLTEHLQRMKAALNLAYITGDVTPLAKENFDTAIDHAIGLANNEITVENR